jgi:hypothetical protein
MKIKDKFVTAEAEMQSFWRGMILSNYALMQCYQWFTILENERPSVKINNEEFDTGKPVEAIRYQDIYNLHFGINPKVVMNELKLHEFFEWFLELEEETFEEETEDYISNWLDFTYMARAYNHYITEVNNV